MKYPIYISRDKVVALAEEKIAYIAKNTDNYDKIASLLKDRHQLDACYDDAYNIIDEELRPFSPTKEEGQEVVTIDMPGHTAATYSDIEDKIQAYLIYAVVKRWFEHIDANIAAAYDKDASERRDRLHKALWERHYAGPEYPWT